MSNLNPKQFYSLADIDHGPEVPHGLRELGVDPDLARFSADEVDVASLHPTHLDDIEDDEDYWRTKDLIGVHDTPPILVADDDERGTYLLDGYARTNAAHTEGRERLSAYRLQRGER